MRADKSSNNTRIWFHGLSERSEGVTDAGLNSIHNMHLREVLAINYFISEPSNPFFLINQILIAASPIELLLGKSDGCCIHVWFCFHPIYYTPSQNKYKPAEEISINGDSMETVTRATISSFCVALKQPAAANLSLYFFNFTIIVSLFLS